MNQYDLVTSLRIAQIAATKAGEYLALAELRAVQAKQPAMATPDNPNPPTPAQMNQVAAQLRHQADGEINMLVNIVMSLVQKPPAKEPELKLAGRLAALNGKAEHDGSAQ